MAAEFMNGALVVIKLPGIATPELSPVGNAYIFLDLSSGKVKISENGGLYTDLVGGGGGGGGGAFVATAPRLITSADNGKWLRPTAAGQFTLGPVADYPAGFEAYVYYPTGMSGVVSVAPDGADHFDLIAGASGASGSSLENSSARTFLRVKLTDQANTWIGAPDGGGWAFTVVAVVLEIQELSPSSGLGTSLGVPATFTLTCYPVNPATGFSAGPALGSVDQDNNYTNGSFQPGRDPVMFTLVNAGGGFNMGPGARFVIVPRDPGSWNAEPSLPLGDWFFQTPFAVGAGETVSFYLDNIPVLSSRIYLRSSSLVPVRSYADAVAAGAV